MVTYLQQEKAWKKEEEDVAKTKYRNKTEYLSKQAGFREIGKPFSAVSYYTGSIQCLREEDYKEVQKELLYKSGEKFENEQIKALLYQFFVFQSKSVSTRGQFQTWLESLSVKDAVQDAYQALKFPKRKKVITFGDQELETALRGKASHYNVIATYLHGNEIIEERKQEIQGSGNRVIPGVILTDGGHAQYADCAEEFSAKANSYVRIGLQEIDMERSIIAFDHPYTTGRFNNPQTQQEGKRLGRNFFAYGERLKVGRYHMMARVRDHANHDTTGVYFLEPEGLYLYSVRRTNVTRHATTRENVYRGRGINPSEQSLVYKYADFKVLFSTLHKLANLVLAKVIDAYGSLFQLIEELLYGIEEMKKEIDKISDKNEIVVVKCLLIIEYMKSENVKSLLMEHICEGKEEVYYAIMQEFYQMEEVYFLYIEVFKKRLKEDMENKRFPKVFKEELRSQIHEEMNIVEWVSLASRVIKFDPQKEALAYGYTLANAQPAGETEFSDDDLP